jgi:hypothetical protein
MGAYCVYVGGLEHQQNGRSELWSAFARQSAADLVVHLGELYARANAEEEFATYLDDLRHRQKRRTKFMAILAEALP